MASLIRAKSAVLITSIIDTNLMLYIWVLKWENVPSDMCSKRWLKSTCACAKSDKSLHCPRAEPLHHWLSKMRPRKILVSLRTCAGWSESSLGAHVRRYVYWRCGLPWEYQLFSYTVQSAQIRSLVGVYFYVFFFFLIKQTAYSDLLQVSRLWPSWSFTAQ